MSRLRIFFLLAALAALATAFAACGSSGSSSENPQQVVDDATLQGIESGNLDLSLRVKVPGNEGGNVDVSISGPFQSEGKSQLPQLDLKAKANGSINDKSVDFEGGLVLFPDLAFVNYEGTDYEVDPTTFSFVKSAIEEQTQQGSGAQGNSADGTACQEAAGDLKVADFVDNLSDEGSADVGGVSTTHVSGDLDVSGAIDSLIALTDDPACSALLGAAGPLPSKADLEAAKGEVSSALKTAHVDLYVGDDNIVRRIGAELSIEPSGESGSGPQKVDVSFDLALNEVNEEQTISAPDGAKPLTNLFLKLGINPIELLEAGSSGGLGGAGGLGGLLNGLIGEAAGGSKGSGGSGGGSPVPGVPNGDPGAQQAYLKCLNGVRTAADLQRCAMLLK